MNEYLQALIRHGASAAGAWLFSHGYVTDSGKQLVAGGILAAGAFLLSLWHKKGVNNLKAQVQAAQSAQPVRVNTLASMLLAFGLLGAALGLTGCVHPQLEQGGAYAPADSNGVATAAADYDLFVVDSAFGLAHDAASAVFKFERDNREMLWKISPSIKHGLDQARSAARAVDLQYAMARTAYLANPLPANLSTLQQLLARAQQLTTVAQTVLSSQGANAPPLPALPSTNAIPQAPAPAKVQ